jgi:hypothetical protein
VNNPSLYQVNTRVWLTDRARVLGRPATLDDITDADIEGIASLGFDWVWLLSVWETGPASAEVSRTDPGLRREFEATLPDLRVEDIAGSGFAVTGYRVHPALGGDAALARLRARLRERGLCLMLDFVPNHTGLDHPWVEEHVEHYVRGTEDDLARSPRNWTRIRRTGGEAILAHGRDPYFDGWADTLQLDYANHATREAMAGELLTIADRCDGVRCDMAMLLLPDVFERTWGRPMEPFWPGAIAAVRERHPDFRLLAEVYWDLEWTMMAAGFDYAYDKRLYDRLREGPARPVRDHLRADLEYQRRLARFLENHDEPRAAATFAEDQHRAAAVVTFLLPGLRFFHEGQLEGRKVHVSMHLGRRPEERVNARLQAFYGRLLAALRRPETHDGTWRLRECRPAWESNPTSDRFFVMSWEGPAGRLLAAVNYGPARGQCRADAGFAGLGGPVVLRDLLGDARYERDAAELAGPGLYLDMPAWGHHVFEVTAAKGRDPANDQRRGTHGDHERNR